MVSHINTLTFNGVDMTDVEVQGYMCYGVPSFTIVGLPDKTIAESRERVRAALSSLAINLPYKRITVNLAPADLVKEGSHFDLAIAACLLVIMDVLPASELANYLILGELSLDGSIMGVSGVLPAAIGASSRSKGIICPAKNGKEAVWSGNKSIIAPASLLALINHFKGTQVLSYPIAPPMEEKQDYLDLKDVIGQDTAKRALEIAATGKHNMLMSGPPGSGKSMLASRLPGLLPVMDVNEILECSMVASIAGSITDGKLVQTRPFRAPHHSCSMAAMVGGGIGRRTSPGEISLAHHGVLFLDEMPEFPRVVLDSLRQPIENGSVLISRSNYHVTYPAKFQLVAAMNPCRCGYLADPSRCCNRAPKCAIDYLTKISGPILDRIDLHIDVPAISLSELNNPKSQPESSKIVAERVSKARQIQSLRYEGYNIRTNNELEGNLLIECAFPDDAGKELLNKAMEKLSFSMRSYNRILKVARTIADLEEAKTVNKYHIAEALSYRQPVIKRD